MPAVNERRTLLRLAGMIVGAVIPMTGTLASPLTGNLSIGAEYDSNVSVDETDFSSRQGDAAALLSARVDVKAIVSKAVTLSLGYSYDRTLHQDLKAYDLGIHQATAGLSLKRGKASLAIDGRFAHILLGGNDFLDLIYVSPSLSSFVSKNAYARIGYSRVTKIYQTSRVLDAETHVMSLDLYRFFNGRRSYVALGLRRDHENATGPEYDFSAWQASARASVPARLLGVPMKLRLSYAYGERDYKNRTASIGERREEKRSTYSLALDAPLSRRLTFKPSFRYVDRDSNLPLFSYREHSIAAILQYTL